MYKRQVQGNLISLPLQRQEATNLLANPRKIRRLITDYKASELGLYTTDNNGVSSVINGVLNQFPQIDSGEDDNIEDDKIAANG